MNETKEKYGDVAAVVASVIVVQFHIAEAILRTIFRILEELPK